MSPYKVWNDWEDKEELITIPRGIISQYVPLSLSFLSFVKMFQTIFYEVFVIRKPSKIIISEYVSVSAYNATLGHKINHSPEPNVDYGFIDHPRFGRIR
jgi:hypothetical protein